MKQTLKSFSQSLEQIFSHIRSEQFWKQNTRLTFLLQTEPGRKKVNPFKFGLPKDQQVSSTDKNLIKILESVPGLGEKKSRHLLEHLPSLQQIVQADQGTILFLLILRTFSSSHRQVIESRGGYLGTDHQYFRPVMIIFLPTNKHLLQMQMQNGSK